MKTDRGGRRPRLTVDDVDGPSEGVQARSHRRLASPDRNSANRSRRLSILADVTTELTLGKTITPRALRRTFNDLARAAQVKIMPSLWEALGGTLRLATWLDGLGQASRMGPIASARR
jgi:hypothetical protein